MLTFITPSLLDPDLITTFGASVKSPDRPTIGHFGTGLKYAIAQVLRLGGTITIDVVGEESTTHQFTTSAFYGTQRVEMTTKVEPCGPTTTHSAGFTTTLGAHWLPWMAFRELWSNCHDEGGKWWLGETPEVDDEIEDYIDTLPEMTRITIECPAVEAAAARVGEFVLGGTPTYELSGLALHTPSEPDHTGLIYYQGIRVYAAPTTPKSIFTYNLTTQTELTEDRTLLDLPSTTKSIIRALLESTDKALLWDLFSALAPGMWEWSFDWNDYLVQPSAEFKALAIAKVRQKVKLPWSLVYMLQSREGDAYRTATHPTPTSWEEALALAPAAPTIPDDVYVAVYVSELKDALAETQAGLEFWKKTAQLLARQLGYTTEAAAEAEPIEPEPPTELLPLAAHPQSPLAIDLNDSIPF